ncbi:MULTISPECIES: hypothetical protein [Micromonospora]|uniref:Uncharacterized protein n=3 Tax=Micromonospora TaxID=1873 RepID=A0A9X0I6C0_9ACTN|nr:MULTISPECIES: hypothetical protein [Micromonospora]AEB42158.1 hypothetical protein VAB18032_05160 [Micromonospora maris AB-18-032]KUJ47677.1 hypothetical protein ADL17_00660 [Micromonospora maris]MBL6276957.1 hypothetical protein [Micromonospora fiedleri]PMR61121.1 hypothetical protein C1A38_11035 [Verrucosispora sp. ts21]RUL91451.1 hypothetical protein EG812_19210 [Verrucosispora sp. FIM060022]
MGQPDEDFAPGDHLSPEERDLEAEPADAIEQAAVVDPTRADDEPHRGFEVDDWDAMEQARVVAADEDDYR